MQTGRPLNVHQFGKLNLPELYKTVTPERHWETLMVNCEYLPREVFPGASKVAGRPIDANLVVVDLKGFGWVSFGSGDDRC